MYNSTILKTKQKIYSAKEIRSLFHSRKQGKHFLIILYIQKSDQLYNPQNHNIVHSQALPSVGL